MLIMLFNEKVVNKWNPVDEKAIHAFGSRALSSPWSSGWTDSVHPIQFGVFFRGILGAKILEQG